ncbi:MAG TPA: YceI family protein [Gemmatimonadales bacterium]|jgi:polyisoprenoid-binding protein YceI|nr:YceI family protein [Gemmatimonadales bacterium]
MKPTLLVALLMPAAVSLAAQTSQQAATTPPPAPTNRWSADPAHSAVNFRVRHLGITWVNGSFGQWTADLNYDPAKPEAASVSAHLQTASITTGNDRRDNDLRANYLAADSFPEITFVSKRVEQVAPDHLRITGDLTIRGITHPVVLETDIGGVLATPRGRRTAFSATTNLKRQDYGITLNRFMEGAQIVGDEVRITIDIEATERTTTP